MTKENKIIDITKLFFAICVIAIHAQLLNGVKYGYLLKCNIYRLAVPFFFVCNGYYLYKNITKEDKLKESIIKYAKVYFILCTIYTIMSNLTTYPNINALNFMNDIRNIFVFKTTNIMWYMGVLLLFNILLLHIKNKKVFKYIFTLSIVSYVLGLYFVTYQYLFKAGFQRLGIEFLNQYYNHNRYFIFTFLFPALGYLIAKHNLIDKIKLKWAVISLIFCQIFLFIESYNYYPISLSYYEYDYFIMTPFVAIFLFIVLNKININLKFSTKKIRKLSANLFYYQFIPIYLYNFFNNKFYNKNLFITINRHTSIYFIYILLFTLILSLMLNIISRKKVNKKVNNKNKNSDF